MKKLETLLFDLDGTLVDTTDLIVRCFNQVWESHFGYTLPRNIFVATIGIPLQQAIPQLIEATLEEKKASLSEPKEQAVARFLADYRKHNMQLHDDLIKPFAGIDEMLNELRERGYRLGVVTSKKDLMAHRSLNIFGLDKFFDVIISADDTAEHKPHPAPIWKGIEKLNSAAEVAAYIGDSTHDMVAGRRAGVVTVAALWGPFEIDELAATYPHYLVNKPLELLSLFV